MTTLSPQAATLPVLRPDVEFHVGPDDPDGSPTYVIHDPLRGTFERATWVQAEVLRRLRVPLTVDRLLRQLSENTTIKVSGEDVTRLCADASRKGLTMDSRVADVREWEAAQKRPGAGGLTTWFRRLVFLRIPLVRPDAFLERTVGFASCLASRGALAAYLCISAIGVILLVQRFDAYLATFPYFFNVQGAVCFTLAIVVVKAIHELSHAYVAKALGNRVPTMGVALIFLFPVAFADVTDSWRMRSRKKRLLISLAGVIAELVIAGLALFVWALSPSGVVKSICFVVSSVTLVTTLLVNLNPAMRFDGYYVLSDLLGLDNLQSRSFAVTRWVLRRHVLGMEVAAPETGLPGRRVAVMVGYSLFAWVYRLFLYVGIALMLYHRLTKVVGGALFVMAIYTFLARPVVTEMISIWKMRRHRFLTGAVRLRPRTIVVALAGGAAVLWAALPLPRWQAAGATTIARESQVIYAPGDGVMRDLVVGTLCRESSLGTSLRTEKGFSVQRWHGRLGRVRKGQTLFVLESEELESRARLARLEVQRIGIELAVIHAGLGGPALQVRDDELRALLPQKTEELARATARLESILTAIDRNRFVAEIDGVVVEWDESVRNGTPIGFEQVLGKIVDHRSPGLVCYLRHNLMSDVAVGDRVYFCPDSRPGRLPGVVTFVDPVRTAILQHRGLSSVAGGDIAVTPDAHGRLEVVDSYYAIEVALDSPPQALRVGQTGTLWLRTAPRSRFADLLRYACRVFIRESSF